MDRILLYQGGMRFFARMSGFLAALVSASIGCGSGPGTHNMTGVSGGAGGFGSGGSDVGGAIIGGLGPLPPPATIDNDLFSTSDRCAFCHTASSSALRDAAGRDVSPYALWSRSMMGFSGRDPYWLAAFSHEITDNPAAKNFIDAVCTRCHAPAAAVTLGQINAHVQFEDITTAKTNEAHLARDGVTCSVCHQIKADNLGQAPSFTGNYEIGTARLIYGPHQNPFTMPMQNNVNYTPTYATHMTDSGLCATCHTVITRALDDIGNPTGPEFPEQVPYLEWQNSDFAVGANAKSCQNCHMPTVDEDGNPISTRISNRPPVINPRSPVGRHLLVGGNAYMLGLIAENAAWTGTNVPQSELLASEKQAQEMLASAATIRITQAARNGNEVNIDVAVDNHSGHKFPTAYPTRRAWIHVTVKDSKGAIIFESGHFDAQGRITNGKGQPIDGAHVVLSHYDEITADTQAQVYEAVTGDASGKPTHVLLRATTYLKDNRLLPAGWSAAHVNAAMTKPIGLNNDANFVPGTDSVKYRFAAPAGKLDIAAELVFQSVPPAAAEVLEAVDTPAAKTFTAMVKKRPPTPTLIASVAATVQ